ncbi:transmembrane protein 132C [Aulostomus maculatus]
MSPLDLKTTGEVPPSLHQPPVPLSLPVHMSAVPPPWQFLPLSQAELGPLFSNSSPFSSSQSLFMLRPPGQVSKPGLQVSFGPYSVTQLISAPVLPLSHPLSASLLSEHVARERDERGQEKFMVRALFHKPGDTSTQGTCVTLHAFRETEEHKASCITQLPLGLCVIALTLPSGWFKHQHTNHSHQDLNQWLSKVHSHRYLPNEGGRIPVEAPRALRYQQSPMSNQIQLYYSSFDPKQPGCVEDKVGQSQRKLFHIKAVTLREEEDKNGQKKEKDQSGSKEEESCLNGMEEEELILDPHVLIRYHRGPVLIGQSIRVSVNLRANFSAEFVVIRLKMKKGLVSMVAQRTLTSGLWAVTLERSQGSKYDMVSILCLKHSTFKHTYNSTVHQQVVCLSVDGIRRSFGVAMTVTANWWVEYSGQSNPPSPHGAAVSVFSFTDRHIVGIAPITESNKIVNTAILTNKPVSLPVIVLAISHDGKVSDVTAAVTCHSTYEDIVKVSNDCSSFFVDGSESGLGNTCAVVEFHLGTLSGSVCLEVWAPSVPLRVSVTDPVLNAIEGWDQLTEEGCVPVYQRSSVQVLTQFTAQDSQSRTTHLLDSSDWFVDVTELVHNWLRVEDPQVAALGTLNTLIGLRPGRTSLHVVSEQWDGMLGSCEIIVTSDTVSPGDLSVQVVSGLGMSVTGSPTHPSIITTTVTAYNVLYNQHQEASISIWLQFSDDTASLLSSFSDIPFFLHLSSLAETVVMVTPGANHRIFAQGDGGGPLLCAEVLISSCTNQPIRYSVSQDSVNMMDNKRGGMRRLAKGSGWIRVNLDLGFLQPVRDTDEEGEEFDFDVSDMLVESESDIYLSNTDDDKDKVERDNEIPGREVYDQRSSWTTTNKMNEGIHGKMVSLNNLERAVLISSPEDHAEYFSPSQKRARDEEEMQGAPELEVGMGAILSLLCLSAVLFLANCLPCTLRDWRRKTTEEERKGDSQRGIKQEGEGKQKSAVEQGKKTGGEDGDQQEQDDNNKDGTEVEIIC